ncbi:unnamed protein product, partial [Ectocarpus fasciculatus]
AYSLLGEYNKAMDIYEQAETIFAGLASPGKLSSVHRQMGRTLIDAGEYQEAIRRLNQAIEKPEVLDDQQLAIVYLWLSESYESLSESDRALEYFKKHVQVKDSLNEKINEKTLAELTSEFEVVRLENEKEISDQLNEIQKLELRQRNLAIVLISIISLIIVISLIANRRRLANQLVISQKDTKLA